MLVHAWNTRALLLLLTSCLSLAGVHSTARADVRLPAIFSDHVVLQQNQLIPVWGWAEPGEQVTITLGQQSYSTVADDGGRWRAVLGSMSAGGPHELIVQGNNTLTVKDVLLGEVWLCSGQSNMEWSVSQAMEADLEVPAANYPNIRMITVPHVGTQQPQEDFEGRWEICTPETAADFSAVGYFFGRQLYQTLNVPIGLIDNSWGGSACEAWVRRDLLAGDPRYQELLDKWDETAATYDHDAALADYQARLKEWQERNAGNRGRRGGGFRRGRGRREPPFREPENPLTGQHRPANLYNGALQPIMGFAIRGAIWYQGESNAERAYQYRALFPLMIQSWRDEWDQGNFPFYWVQLANYKSRAAEPQESAWAELREAQTSTLSQLPNSGEAVIIDLGEADDIHPTNKQDVAKRLARWALARDYGLPIVYESPRFDSFQKREDNRIQIRYNFGRDQQARLEVPDGEEIKGFQIAGEDRKFVWARARVLGRGGVEVWSDEVAEPVAVRYAWADNPDCNLRNQVGLPATPFRTDDWPGVTADVHK